MLQQHAKIIHNFLFQCLFGMVQLYLFRFLLVILNTYGTRKHISKIFFWWNILEIFIVFQGLCSKSIKQLERLSAKHCSNLYFFQTLSRYLPIKYCAIARICDAFAHDLFFRDQLISNSSSLQRDVTNPACIEKRFINLYCDEVLN